MNAHQAPAADETNPPSGRASPDGRIAPQRHSGATPAADFCRQIENEIPFLRRTVRRWRCDGADVDDLVQDTLVRALASAHLWQPGTDLRAWLYTIMRNQFLAVVAKSNRSASILASFRAADPHPAADSLEARLILRNVDAALRRLPSKQRSAVCLVGIEGKSYVEVASTMGTSVGAVRCHLARARGRLRAAVHGADTRSPLIPRPPATPTAMASRPALGFAGAD